MSNKVIDAHVHIFTVPSIKKSEKIILDSMKKYHIDYSLVSFDGSEYCDEESRILYSQLKGTTFALDFARKHSKKIGILPWIRPHKEHNVDELEELIKNNLDIIHGLKFHPYCSRLKITSKHLIPYIELARKYNLPILVHTAYDEYSSIGLLVKVANKYKDINFIAAHLELNTDNKYAINCLKETPNLYGDTARVNPKNYRLIKKLHLEDKIMFGTDNPIDGLDTYNHPYYKKYLNKKFKIDDEDYKKLMYLNAKKIYKIDLK